MALEADLWPPIDAANECEPITFDFGNVLAPGETITGVALLACSVISGVDPAPEQRILTGVSIVDSPASAEPLAAVVVSIGNMVGGVKYRLQCVVITSAPPHRPSIITRIECKA